MWENTAREHAAFPFGISFEWDAISEKMKKACTREKIAMALVAGTMLVLYVAVSYWLIQAFQNYTIIGY